MALDILVVEKYPFVEQSNEKNFNTDEGIEVDEWEELLKFLQAPIEVERLEGENRLDFLNRKEKLFREDLKNKGYEMLGRIWHYYIDAFYKPSEVDKLLEECLDVQQKTQNQLAQSALEKLIFACKEALRVKSGIMLFAD